MLGKKTLTFMLMDAPFETARTTTALRLIDTAARRGYDINVFAYEGAVCLPLKDQAPHANPVKGTTLEEEEHPNTKNFVAALLELGRESPHLNWINCGLCVDERGAANVVEGVKRGSPADFFKMVSESTNTLVIPTR